MSFTGSYHFAAGMHSDAVSNATGKGWFEWFNLLDRAGVGGLHHKEITQYLREKQGLSGWWSRMVTVGYEQACGKRAIRLREKSFTIHVSRSFDTDIKILYKAWASETWRSLWLTGHPILIRKAVADRSMRITWSDEVSGLLVEFWEAGPGSSGLSVRHVNLASSEQAAAQEGFWKAALDRLGLLLYEMSEEN